MRLTEFDERVIRACGIDRAAFEATRALEEAEKAATAEHRDPDGLTAADLRVIRSTGIARAQFLETRRSEAQP